jgi:hypothetical protein
MSQNTLRMVYFSCFHSIMHYGLLFLGNSSYSMKILRLQKCIIRIICGCKSRDSCRQLFTKIQILLLPSQYILTIPLFVVKNKNLYKENLEVHNINTRQHCNLHQPLPSLVKYQKGIYCDGTEVFNCLPSYTKIKSDNPRVSKLTLKHFLHNNSFYSLKEYLQYNTKLGGNFMVFISNYIIAFYYRMFH